MYGFVVSLQREYTRKGGGCVKRLATICFLTLVGILYILFLAGDLLCAYHTTWLKFTAIMLVAAMGFLAGKRRENRLITAALVLTLTADVFLLVLDAHYAFGIALFLAVQLLYTLRLAVCGGAAPWRTVLARFVPALAVSAATAQYGVRITLPAAYIVWFAVNLADSIRLAAAKPERRSICFAVGLALFFCCDLCVGMYNLPDALLPLWLSGFARVAMWGFYLPGQVLILASTEALGGRQA